jgi:hypothetical protein
MVNINIIYSSILIALYMARRGDGVKQKRQKSSRGGLPRSISTVVDSDYL